MKKLIIGIILVLLLASQAQATKTVVEKEVVVSERGWLGEQLGWGDRLFKITYNDGTVNYILAQSSFLQPASITYLKETVDTTVNVNSPSVPFTVNADVSPAMGGSDTLVYKYSLYKGSCTSGELRQTFGGATLYGQTVEYHIEGSPFTSVGVYNYCLQEYIYMVSVSPPVWAKGNSKLLRVTVTDPIQPTGTVTATTTPQPTTPSPTSTTPSGTATSTSTGKATATGTPTPTTTSSVDVTYGAGSEDITYRGVDIRSEDGIYYVGDIPHDSVPEARKTIDEMIAGKEEKPSILDQINTPFGWVVVLIIGIVVIYFALPDKPSKEGLFFKRKKKGK